MTTMVTELYDALQAAGAPEDKARKAAEVLSNYDDKFARLNERMSSVEGRIGTLSWMVGTNITLTLLVLGKLFLMPIHG